VSYENQNDFLPERNNDSLFSKRLKAGKKRTYFFDVKATRGQDYYITLTESKKRLYDEGYEKHKLFLYKEDFNKFQKALGEAIDFVKTELMPDFDFDAFNHDQEYIPPTEDTEPNYNTSNNPEGHTSEQDNW
jgi:hypothetical protein